MNLNVLVVGIKRDYNYARPVDLESMVNGIIGYNYKLLTYRGIDLTKLISAGKIM